MYKTFKLVGITGVAKSGKDTFYSISEKVIEEKYKLKTKRVAFADSLKDSLHQLINSSFGLDINNLSPENKEVIRPLMVAYGKAARDIQPDFWIDVIKTKLNNFEAINNEYLYPRDSVVFITDVRYQNEVNFIREMGGEVIGVRKMRNYFSELPPANEEEAQNTLPLLAQIPIHQVLTWEHVGNNRLDLLKPKIDAFWAQNSHLLQILA